MKLETIYIPKQAYLQLRNRQRVERGGQALTAEALEKIWARIPQARKKGDLIRVDKDSLGGGDGTRRGKWVSWDVPTLKRMTEELGYSWKQGEEIECDYI